MTDGTHPVTFSGRRVSLPLRLMRLESDHMKTYGITQADDPQT